MTSSATKTQATSAFCGTISGQPLGSGSLQVFLGMCRGAGKTHRMLEAALQQQTKGLRVLVGAAESHGSPEIEGMLAHLPSLPCPDEGNGGRAFSLDHALSPGPTLMVVDDMAAVNEPGSRHARRYQDILELLDGGVDVLTTLNIQEIESQAKVLPPVLGLHALETVPDSILDRAQIVLVDVSVATLLERVSEGKVDFGENKEWAAANFFTPSHLTALREMALRFAASRVDRDLQEICRQRHVGNPLRNQAPMVVGVGPGHGSEKVIRWAHHEAAQSDSPWVAVWVDGVERLLKEEKDGLVEVLRLAQRLGAEIGLAFGSSVASELLREARTRGASRIVVGGSAHGSQRSVASQLLRECADINVCVVQSEWGGTLLPTKFDEGNGRSPLKESALFQYLLAAFLPFAIAGACWRFAPVTGPMLSGTLFLLVVAYGGLRMTRGPLLLVTILSVLVWDYFYLTPIFAIRKENVVIIAMFVIMALSFVDSLLRKQYWEARRHQRETEALLNVTERAAFAAETSKGLGEALRTINGLFGAKTCLIVCGEDAALPDTPHEASTFRPTSKEWQVIRSCHQRREPLGRFVGSSANADATWFPIQTATAVMGLLGVWLPSESSLDFNSQQLLQALSLQLALALEKERFMEAIRHAEVMEASEHLRRTLLDSVSHELKTPLSALKSATEELELDPSQVTQYLPDLRAALRRLRRTVDNLLNMSRLESGAAKPVLDWCEVDEIVEAALELIGDALNRHRFDIDMPGDLPMVRLDRALIEQALANLLINAATHTPAGSEVTLRARFWERRLVLAVLDRGPGLLEGEAGRLFQKFARGEGAPAGGSGLGLAIARGFASAHGGSAEARAREGGGTEFALMLPVEAIQHDLNEIGTTSSTGN